MRSLFAVAIRGGVLIQLLGCAVAYAAIPSTTDLQNQLKQLQQSISQSNASGGAIPAQVTTTTSTTNTAPTAQQVFAQAAAGSNAPSNAAPPAVVTQTEVVNNPNLNAPIGTIPPPGQQQATVVTTTTTAQDQADAELSLRDEAFGRMTNSTLPMNPAQIQMLRALYDMTQKAAATYPGVPPRPTTSSLAVDLSPGATPPIVRLGAGFVTSLVFVDATGSPWPVDSISIGNPTAFNVQWDKKSNILLVQAITAYRTGNLAVILRGLNTPVMVELKPGQAAMDARVDLRIPALGPEAKPMVSGLPGTQSPYLISLLDGIPPPGSKALKTTGCDNCAWFLDGKLYIRTEYTILSPAWISTLSSADGTHVYEMSPTPLILASYNGKVIKINIEGY